MTRATLDNELRIGMRPRLFLAKRDGHLRMKNAVSTCGHQNVNVLGQATGAAFFTGQRLRPSFHKKGQPLLWDGKLGLSAMLAN
jgi:hypothetical protein